MNEYQHQSELIDAIYQATKESHGMQRDEWVGSLYLLHPSGWSIYCTPFWQGEKCTTVVAVSEDGDTSEVVSVLMGHQPHSRTVEENLARYISILPLIKTIGDALVRRATASRPLAEYSVQELIGIGSRVVRQFEECPDTSELTGYVETAAREHGVSAAELWPLVAMIFAEELVESAVRQAAAEVSAPETVWILQVRQHGEDDQVFVKATREEAEAIVKPCLMACTINGETMAKLQEAETLDELQTIAMDNEIGHFDIFAQSLGVKA